MDKPPTAFDKFLMLKGRILAIELVIRHSLLTSTDPVITTARLAEFLNQQQGSGENTTVDDWVLVGFQESVEHMLPKLGDAKEAGRP